MKRRRRAKKKEEENKKKEETKANTPGGPNTNELKLGIKKEIGKIL